MYSKMQKYIFFLPSIFCMTEINENLSILPTDLDFIIDLVYFSNLNFYFLKVLSSLPDMIGQVFFSRKRLCTERTFVWRFSSV